MPDLVNVFFTFKNQKEYLYPQKPGLECLIKGAYFL